MEESKLIALAQKGDQSAFAQLLERYERPVFHHALRLLSNPEDAADITQEVFFKVWKSLPSFRGSSSLSTWLYRLTDNAAIDFLRREKKRRGDSSLDDDESGRQNIPAGPESSPQDAAERRELHRALADGLAALSFDHRQVLLLREVEGLSYAEIARQLSLTEGTVKSRLARARLALAKQLQTAGTFP